MSLTSYQAAPPCNKGRCISVHASAAVNGFFSVSKRPLFGPGRPASSSFAPGLSSKGKFALARPGSASSFARLQVLYPVFFAANFRRICRSAAVWLGLGCALLGRGEPPTPPWRAKDVVQYSFENHGLELGLPGTVVTTAIQTRDGYLWVGTPSGLARFDGVRFTGFAGADTPGLSSDLIHCLREDRQGALWIGTDRGLTRFADGRFTQVGFENQSVRALAEDEEGNLWIGTWGEGVHVLRAG